jgi:hypothetical protein
MVDANHGVSAADMTAYKFKPEDPGGIEVLHQARRTDDEIRHGSEVAPGWPQVARKHANRAELV